MKKEQIMLCQYKLDFYMLVFMWVVIGILKQLIYICVLGTCNLIEDSLLEIVEKFQVTTA